MVGSASDIASVMWDSSPVVHPGPEARSEEKLTASRSGDSLSSITSTHLSEQQHTAAGIPVIGNAVIITAGSQTTAAAHAPAQPT